METKPQDLEDVASSLLHDQRRAFCEFFALCPLFMSFLLQVYVKKNGDSLQSVIMEDNLKLCLVRPAPSSIERSGCFELVSRSG